MIWAGCAEKGVGESLRIHPRVAQNKENLDDQHKDLSPFEMLRDSFAESLLEAKPALREGVP